MASGHPMGWVSLTAFLISYLYDFSGARPICDMLVGHGQWSPDGMGQSAGLQFANTSFLGAFLSPSVFPEEDTGDVCSNDVQKKVDVRYSNDIQQKGKVSLS